MDYVEQRMAQEAQKDIVESLVFFTPLNVLLSAIVLYTVFAILRPSKSTNTFPPDPPAVVFKTYTPHTLLPFDGKDGKPVFLAVRGRVFDVSLGRNFYGPGGPYENFAGRDASRGLASHSFDEEMLTKDLDGPLDPLTDLDDEQREAMQGWEERFESKYMVVGRLVSVADFEK
ncbi:membrane-associated progesterone receptor component 1 [Ophiostoma piceae UAMH 11346]|uniref:Membrane-associated progesterone receptor component 1 n=1 Tax=Ophiostoma piceae (strain UAMH 11346) TaxID=1262450 RepID=S3CC29_OPHP1|nr:membrane-associated progesterone receptor component 1 [Ophiostoma piceae UAMH 11346]